MLSKRLQASCGSVVLSEAKKKSKLKKKSWKTKTYFLSFLFFLFRKNPGVHSTPSSLGEQSPNEEWPNHNDSRLSAPFIFRVSNNALLIVWTTAGQLRSLSRWTEHYWERPPLLHNGLILVILRRIARSRYVIILQISD